MNSKTRMRPSSELSSSAPLARFSADNDEPAAQQPQRSHLQVHVHVTTPHARKKFGRKIQALRQQAGLTHADLSKEFGDAEPGLFTIISLAEKLQTTAEDLLKEIE